MTNRNKQASWNPTIKLTMADRDEVEALVDKTPRATAHGILCVVYRLGMAALREDPSLLPPLLPRTRLGRRSKRASEPSTPSVDFLDEIEGLSLDASGPAAEPAAITGPKNLDPYLEEILSDV